MSTISASGVGGGVTAQLPSEPTASVESARGAPVTSDSLQSVPWSAPTPDLPPLAASAASGEFPAADGTQLQNFVRQHVDDARAQFANLFPEKIGELRRANVDERLLNQMLDAIDNAFGEDFTSEANTLDR